MIMSVSLLQNKYHSNFKSLLHNHYSKHCSIITLHIPWNLSHGELRHHYLLIWSQKSLTKQFVNGTFHYTTHMRQNKTIYMFLVPTRIDFLRSSNIFLLLLGLVFYLCFTKYWVVSEELRVIHKDIIAHTLPGTIWILKNIYTCTVATL